MGMIQVKELTTAEEVLAHARMIQARRRACLVPVKPPEPKIAEVPIIEAPKPKPVPVVVIVPAPEPVPELPPEPPRKTAHEILHEVARKHDLSVLAVMSFGRQRALVKARQEYAYRALEETALPSTTIGRIINRDHTTVLHNANAHCFWNQLPLPRGATWSQHKILRPRKKPR